MKINNEWLAGFIDSGGCVRTLAFSISPQKRDFLYWLQIYQLILKNEHLTKEGLTKIKELRNLMNLNRTNLIPRIIF